jgi:hypothetical protein
MNKNSGHNAMKIGILEFCGIKPVKISSFAPVKSSDEVKRYFTEMYENEKLQSTLPSGVLGQIIVTPVSNLPTYSELQKIVEISFFYFKILKRFQIDSCIQVL